MTASAPAPMPRANGTAGPAFHSSQPMPLEGREMCESASVSPWPGKCLSVLSTIPRSPATACSTRAAASSGVVPRMRSAMNDDGSAVSSATMPKLRSTPAAFTSAARWAKASRVVSGGCCRRVEAEGNTSSSSRDTIPPS